MAERRVIGDGRHRGRSVVRLVAMTVLLLALGGCRGCTSSRPPIHLNPNMDEQPKLLPQSASAFFADGAAMRPPVPGTVAREEAVEVGWMETGRGPGGGPIAAMPLAASPELLARGAQRYAVFCSPCHGESADGKGMLFDRAQIVSADLTDERIAAMPDGQIFDTVTHGFGLMGPYGQQIPPGDRWAIIAYLRALQRGEEVAP